MNGFVPPQPELVRELMGDGGEKPKGWWRRVWWWLRRGWGVGGVWW